MRTIVITKVYEIRESRRGGSWTFEMFFNLEKAQRRTEELNALYSNTNFRIVEHNTTDMIIYTESK